jgi:hypothetical protein
MATELAARENGGVTITLFWDADTNDVFVCVTDSWSGESFSVDVEGASALEAFYHPYAYASRCGIEETYRSTETSVERS